MCLADHIRTVFDSNSQFPFDVLNNFIKNLLNVKSSDCIYLLSKLHTSRAYSKIGKHFLLQKLNHNFLRSRFWQIYHLLQDRKTAQLCRQNISLEFSTADNKNTKIANFVYPPTSCDNRVRDGSALCIASRGKKRQQQAYRIKEQSSWVEIRYTHTQQSGVCNAPLRYTRPEALTKQSIS